MESTATLIRNFAKPVRNPHTAAALGAPQAIQVADRWHVLRNLTDLLQAFLARSRPEVRQAGQEAEEAVVQNLKQEWRPIPIPATEKVRLSRRAQRVDQYEQVIALSERGLTPQQIARKIGHPSERTIKRWIAQGAFPEVRRRRKKRSRFDIYAPYVLKRWQEGCHNVAVKRDFAKSLLTGIMKG